MSSRLVAATTLLLACAAGETNETSTTASGVGGASSSTTSANGGTGGEAGSDVACLAGEIDCGESCIVGDDCAHAVAVDAADERLVWVNGATFVRFTIGIAADISAVRVGASAAGFHVIDPTHVRVEIPPGPAGTADVVIDTPSGSTTTKRALQYRADAEGTEWTLKTMATPRGGFPAIATTLDNRAFLGAGYTSPQTFDDCTETADLFDPDAVASEPAASSMSTRRWTATATTLLDGRTVVAGACYTLGPCPFDSTLIDLFDPTTNAFAPSSASLTAPRGFLRNLRLADGRVLFASDEAPHFEIYDPDTDSTEAVIGGVFSTLSPVTGWMARLQDGRVLVVPGGGAENSIFDPSLGSFVPTGDSLPHYPDALVSVPDGRVLAIGGITVADNAGTLEQTTTGLISVFDPTVGHFVAWSTALGTARTGSTAILARDGNIYVIGGMSGSGKLYLSCASDADVAPFSFLSSVEIIDPVAETVVAGPALPEANISLRSTILFDGSIIAGGGTPCGSSAVSYPSVYFLEAPEPR
jgi:hypothetical protein